MAKQKLDELRDKMSTCAEQIKIQMDKQLAIDKNIANYNNLLAPLQSQKTGQDNKIKANKAELKDLENQKQTIKQEIDDNQSITSKVQDYLQQYQEHIGAKEEISDLAGQYQNIDDEIHSI
jgi:DNA repair exonuclease SbcCD ATPase subunit